MQSIRKRIVMIIVGTAAAVLASSLSFSAVESDHSEIRADAAPVSPSSAPLQPNDIGWS